MDRHASRINHVGLTLLGLILLAAGVAALARGLGAFGGTAASEPLITGAMRRYAAEQAWFWPVVAACGVVLALLGLLWLMAQGRSERLPALTLDEDTGEGSTHLSDKAVTKALEDEIAAYPGVRNVSARLLGRSKRPRLRLNVTYGWDADLVALRRRIDEEAVDRLRTALERESLPTVVRLSLVPGGHGRRVV
ncbi:hypothetical protein Acsp03_60750 [Actinomadura sp. NBRC 104412]|uniref:alkaline shock response membrane anchor protein AmaP n=1 Tax=Actinomadura sp. NBRC 104412 TaxID=3032203 RepID=UPI0024A20C57|nr:alkaline shock response membrane anchor protein AmaP [Actinomadura sp. NBRC 104412]GLZ08609.1 hypothetical protein Acsp03_60750 [Actinomadura sp. NBRC 104412]